jgi:hypothetical protein
MVPLTRGGYGRSPRVSYAVAACGDRTFRGVLLGGQARIDDVNVVALPVLAPR